MVIGYRGIVLFAALALLVAAGAGCVDEKLSLGESCEVNSECDAPLVCRISRCRVECVNARDCAAGLNCVLDAEKLGACQLPEEKTCVRTSDCIGPLVCPMGTCTNQCGCANGEPCRDCTPGATCIDGACVDMSGPPCVYSTECATGLICATDQRCREECLAEADCRFGLTCVERDFGVDGTSRVCEFPMTGVGP